MSKKIWIFTDYDGTVTGNDTLEYLLDKYAPRKWKEIEKKVENREISEIEALQAEFDLLDIDRKTALDTIREEIEIDEYFEDFLEMRRENDYRLTVLSGGFREFIREKLDDEGIGNIDIKANGIEVENGEWEVTPADTKRLCPLCNHCKTSSLLEASERGFITLYIGDGTTDCCPAYYADLIFARDYLKRFCVRQSIPFESFEDFSDVMDILGSTSLERRNISDKRVPPRCLDLRKKEEKIDG